MTTSISRVRAVLAATTFLTSAAGLAVGCSSSSSTATTTDGGGTHDTGTKGSGSGTSKGTGSGSGASTLYTRLGEHAGIRKAVNAIVAQELANADIASYFFFQAGAPGNGHPTAGQIEECFTDLVANAAGGPEQYPTTLAADAGSFVCRSMSDIHKPLLINSGTFTEFVMIAGAELKTLGVSSADIATLAGALEGTAPSIVTSDGGLQAFPGSTGSGSGSGASKDGGAG